MTYAWKSVIALAFASTILTVTTQEETKIGKCPPVMLGEGSCIRPTNQSAANQCKTDKNCPGDEKCCKPVCTGKRCTDPVSPCVCPYVKQSTTCTSEGIVNCKSSSNCGALERCCLTECGGSSCISQVKVKTVRTTPSDDCPPVDPFVMCPEIITSHGYNTCTRDAQCKKKGQKCCATDCNGKQCVTTVKVGSCPVINLPPGTITSALATCANDSSCPFQRKCCPYGVGIKCQCPDYAAEFNVNVVHAGNCPPLPPCAFPGPGDFPNLCKYDAQCQSNEKCCSFCGFKCVKAYPNA